MSARVPVALSAVLGIVAAVALAGCAPTVDLNPAPPHANDPHCADVMVRLPDALDDGKGGTLAHRDTNAQSTAAWGDPTAVILSCGVKVPGATTLPCIQIDSSIYWLREKDAGKKVWRFTTFGRDPAITLTISTALSPGVLLDQLNGDVGFLPKNGHACSSTEDTVTGEGLPSDTTPSPAPSATPSESPAP
jgi:hypothetical protein